MGFVVQTDFAGGMMESAAKAGDILPLVDQYNVSKNSKDVEWIEVDETSVATTCFGGVIVYWAKEASTVDASKPALVNRKLELQKLLGFAYATYELESDSNFVSQLYEKAFTLAIRRELEGCIVSGGGAGKPLGFLNGGDLVTVDKETDQEAATVMWENISKMYHRAKTPRKSIWLGHPDVSEQFDFLSFPVGVGGVPVYLGPSKEGDVGSLKGRPVLTSDHCSALGTAGDLNFVDLSQYMLIKKGGTKKDVSMHVQFLTAQNCFRFIFRANGMPKKDTTLTLKNSSKTRANFVTLQTRS